jgi:hypothetical protein
MPRRDARAALCPSHGFRSRPSAPPPTPRPPLPPRLTAPAARCASARLSDFISYEDLEPYADAVDVKGMWRRAGLPPPPPVLCHVGMLGWHCHNTTLNPWNPKSLLPKGALPPMPGNATCVICPHGWTGRRGSLVELMLDLPIYVRSRGAKLPPGMWDGEKLLAAEAEKLAAAAAAGGGGANARAAGANATAESGGATVRSAGTNATAPASAASGILRRGSDNATATAGWVGVAAAAAPGSKAAVAQASNKTAATGAKVATEAASQRAGDSESKAAAKSSNQTAGTKPSLLARLMGRLNPQKA